MSSDSEEDKDKEKEEEEDGEKKKNGEEENDDEDDEIDENVERINASFIAKKLLDQKDCRIIGSKRRVNDVKEDHVDVSGTQNPEKDEVISSANKKDVDEILTLITKTYTFA